MAESSERPYETNEISWWSNWAQTEWLDRNAYLIFSKDFSEYFFNRGGFLQMTPGSRLAVGAMEREFSARRRRPHIFIKSDRLDSRLLKTLEGGGYRIADQMAVMEMGEPSFKLNGDLKVRQVTKDEAEDWSEVYLDSFYGELGKMKAVTAAVRRLARTKEASVLLGSLDGRPAGTLALYRTGGLCGVYCVGTHRGFRRRRVASTLLESACATAASEGRRLILQTILSDSVEGIYLKFGFKRRYLKELFVKSGAAT